MHQAKFHLKSTSQSPKSFTRLWQPVNVRAAPLPQSWHRNARADSGVLRAFTVWLPAHIWMLGFGFRLPDSVEAVKKRLLTEMQDVYQTIESAPVSTPSSPQAPPTASSTSVPSMPDPSSQGPMLASSSAATKGGIWTDFDLQVLSSQHHRSAVIAVQYSFKDSTSDG